MSCTTLCLNKIPEQDHKLFFGDSGNFLRLDKQSHPELDKIFKNLFSKVWAWTAINFDGDSIVWEKIDEIGQRIFLLNNGYQTVMDSGVVNIYNYLTLVANNNELSTLYQYIAQNELTGSSVK